MNASKRRLSQSSVGLLLTLFMVVMGGISLVAGMKGGAESWAFTSRSIRVQGVVIRHDQGVVAQDGKVVEAPTRNEHYRPVVSYIVDGKSYEAFGPVHGRRKWDWPKVSPVGSSVTILYDPDRPAEGLVESFEVQWGEAALFSVLGLLFLPLGIVLLWRRRNLHVGEQNRA